MHTLCYERRNGSSILSGGTNFVGALCNGSTTDFDSVSLGSIPSAPAILLGDYHGA